MSELYSVTCPHCQASGQLSDPTLQGTAIYCPACSKPFVVPAANIAPMVPQIPPVVVASPPLPTEVAVAAPVTQPVAPPLAAPIAAPAIPSALPVAIATPVIPVAAAMPAIPLNQPGTNDSTPGDFPNLEGFSPPTLQAPGASAPQAAPRRASVPQSPILGLLKVVVLSIFSAVMLFGIVVYSQKTPQRRSPREIAANTKKPKKSSRRKATTAAPRPASVPSEEMPETDDIKPAEPKLELAATTPMPAAPKMEKPAAPPPATPKSTEPPQTAENIPADAKRELDDAMDKKDLPSLIKLLAHSHAVVRERAVQCLGYLDPMPDLAAQLLPLLADASPEVRRMTIGTLVKHGASLPESIPALGKALRQDGDSVVRAYAAGALAELAAASPERTAAAAGPLLEALEKGPAEDLYTVIGNVGSLGDAAEPAIPLLITLSKEINLGEEAATALARLGHFEALEQIIATKDGSTNLRKCAIAAGIEKRKPLTKEAFAVIKRLSEDADDSVRARALNALGRAEPKLPEAIPLFEAALASTNENIRKAATTGMGLYASIDPIRNMRSLLTQMLKSPDEVWAQGEIATAMKGAKHEGFTALLQILADPQTPPEMRTVAGQVVAMSSEFDWYDAKHVDALKKLFDAPDQSLTIRTGCAIAMMTLDETDPRLATTLLDAARDKSLDIQVREAAFLKAPKNEQAWFPVAIAAAEECEIPPPGNLSEAEKRKRALFYGAVLSKFIGLEGESQKLVLPRVVAALRYDDFYVRLIGLNVAARVEYATPEVIAAIRPILKNETPGVRGDAARTLGKFGPLAAEVVPDLIALVSDEKDSTLHAAEALAKIAPQNEAAVAAVIKALDRDYGRDDVITAIRVFGPIAGAAVPTLQKLLPESDEGRERGIILALGALGEAAKPAVPDIAKRLTHKDEFMRQAAGFALIKLNQHAAGAVPDLVKALNDSKEHVQVNVLKALGGIGPAAKPAIPEIEKLIAATTSDNVKTTASNTVQRLQADPGDADPVLFDRLLDDAKWEELSKNYAGQLELSISELRKLIRNENSEVRERAWGLLDGLGRQPAGRSKLENLLNGSELGDQAFAAALLRKLPANGGSIELAQSLLPWIGDARTNGFASHVLIQIGAPANPVIATVLTNDKLPPSIRLSLVYSILSPSTFRVSLLLPLLQPALKSETPSQRLAAALAILQLDPRNAEALPLVVACLPNADKDLEEYALEGLLESAKAEVDVRAAIPDLIAILAKLPADLARDFLDNDPRTQARYKASAILWITRARPEDLPALHAGLARLAAPKDRDGQPIEKINSSAAWKIGNSASMIIQALGTIGAPATVALPEIRQILTHGRGVNDEGVAERYAQGIVGIGEPAIEMVIALAKQPDANRRGRVLAIQVLGRIGDGDQRTTAILTELLKDPDVEVRVAAAMILAEQSATFEAAVPALSEGLKIGHDPESYYDGRGNIIERMLGFTSQAQGAVPGLLELVKNEKTWEELRIQTARALLQISPDAPEVRAAYLACMISVSEYRTDNLLAPIDKLPATLMSEIVAELTRVVADAAHPRREAAARLLGQFEDKSAAALPALRALIAADQGPLGATATIAVARIDPTAKDLVPRVVELLINDLHRQSEAAEALRRQGPNAASELPKIIKFYQTRGGFDYQGFRIIGRMGAEAKPGLPILLEETLKKERFNYSAFEALKELGPHAAELWPQLLTQLQDHDDLPGVALALAAIGGEPAREAVAILQKQLADENRRLGAIRQLAEFKALAAPAVPELIKFAEGTDIELRQAALYALYSSGFKPQENAEMLATRLTDPDPQVSGHAAYELGVLGAAALPVLPQVIAALEKPQRYTQSHLIDCLQKLGPAAKDAIPTLKKLQATTDLKLRHQIRLALKKIEPKAP